MDTLVTTFPRWDASVDTEQLTIAEALERGRANPAEFFRSVDRPPVQYVSIYDYYVYVAEAMVETHEQTRMTHRCTTFSPKYVRADTTTSGWITILVCVLCGRLPACPEQGASVLPQRSDHDKHV